MRLLKRYTRKIILALDPDSAGEKATMKGLEVARETMDHSPDFVFDPKGLIRTEARLDADIRVCSLPDGLDPDEIALDDPERWEVIIQNAKPIITHVIDTLTEGKDLEDPKTKSDIAAQVVPLIKDVSNAVERDTYRQQLARTLHVDERSLFSLSETQYISRRRSNRKTQPVEPAAMENMLTSEKTKIYNLEKHIVLLLLREPEMIYELNRYLNKNELPDLDSSDFQSGDLRSALEVILHSIQQVDQDADDFIRNSLAQEVLWLYDDLAQLIPEKITPDRILEDLTHTFLNLRRDRIKEKINNLTILQESVEDTSLKVSDPAVQSDMLASIKMRSKLDKVLSTPHVKE